MEKDIEKHHEYLKEISRNNSLSYSNMMMLLQIESYYLLKNINRIIERESINRGNFPK